MIAARKSYPSILGMDVDKNLLIEFIYANRDFILIILICRLALLATLCKTRLKEKS